MADAAAAAAAAPSGTATRDNIAISARRARARRVATSSADDFVADASAMPSTQITALSPSERAELIASIASAKSFAGVPADVVAAAAKSLSNAAKKAPPPKPKVSKEDADATFAVIVIPNGARHTMEICAKLEKRFRLVGLHHHREALATAWELPMPDSLGALRLMVGPEAPASLRAVYGDHQLSEPLVGAAAAAWINPASCFEPSEPPPPPPLPAATAAAAALPHARAPH